MGGVHPEWNPDTRPVRLSYIALSISSDLNTRLEALNTGNPFETKAWAEPTASRKSPEAFDLLDVPDYLDEGDAATVRAAKHAITSNPFG